MDTYYCGATGQQQYAACLPGMTHARRALTCSQSLGTAALLRQLCVSPLGHGKSAEYVCLAV